ncbi:MAG: hypothetical protein SOZ84_04680 [Treponema sp.]|nr:hypothetical protein [Treponema sp.]
MVGIKANWWLCLACSYIFWLDRARNLWKAGQIQTLSQEAYLSLLKQALALVQEYTRKTQKPIVIHRLTGDGPKKILLAPLWTANKKKVLNDLKSFLTPALL